MDPAEEHNLEQAPTTGRQKNLLSRYSGSRRRSSDPGSALLLPRMWLSIEGRAWNLMASLTASRSGEGLNSSQNSLGTSVGASTQASKDDALAQAAENWIKSTEETGAAQFSADEEDIVRAEKDAKQVTARLADQDSVSTNGSDDERPALEDGAFPSLKDARIPFGPTRLSFDNEAAVSDEAQWKDVSPRSTDLFIETRNIGPWDKMSEESPVSVMAVPNRRVRRATSGSQTRTLLPPKESARRRRPASRPASILRSGRHSGAKEVSAKIQSVKSARVKFHEEVVRGTLNARQQASNSDEYVSSYLSSEPDGFVSTENNMKDKAVDTMTPQDWAAFIERDTSILSPVSEVDSLQTEQSHQSGTSGPRGGPVENVLGISSASDGEWPLRMSESKTSTVRSEINMFPEVPDSDHEWALDEDDRASFGTFGQFKAEEMVSFPSVNMI